MVYLDVTMTYFHIFGHSKSYLMGLRMVLGEHFSYERWKNFILREMKFNLCQVRLTQVQIELNIRKPGKTTEAINHKNGSTVQHRHLQTKYQT